MTTMIKKKNQNPSRFLSVGCMVIAVFLMLQSNSTTTTVSADSLTDFQWPFHIELPVNWVGFGWLWLDFGMLFRESLCTALVNNDTDPVLLGSSVRDQGWLAVMGPALEGYLVPRSYLTAAHLALSDRYEVTPIHLAWEWRNVTLLPGERVTGMRLGLGGKRADRPEMVVQTATRRLTLTSRSWEVFTENWSPPDGVVFLSTTRASHDSLLAIRNQQHQFCLIRWWSEMEKVTQQRLGQPWGPVGVESWPPSLCIPSVSPVTCAGVIDPDYSSGSNATTSAGGADRSHRILATFINRTVSLLEFRSTGFTVVRHFGRFRMFFDCYDTNRYILLLLAILLVITVVLAIIYFVYRILSQRNAAVKKGGPATSAATSATSNAESSVASSSAAASSAAVSSRQQPLSSVPGMAKVEETSKESTKQSTITKNEAKSPRSAKRSQKTSPAGRR